MVKRKFSKAKSKRKNKIKSKIVTRKIGMSGGMPNPMRALQALRSGLAGPFPAIIDAIEKKNTFKFLVDPETIKDLTVAFNYYEQSDIDLLETNINSIVEDYTATNIAKLIAYFIHFRIIILYNKELKFDIKKSNIIKDINTKYEKMQKKTDFITDAEWKEVNIKLDNKENQELLDYVIFHKNFGLNLSQIVTNFYKKKIHLDTKPPTSQDNASSDNITVDDYYIKHLFTFDNIENVLEIQNYFNITIKDVKTNVFNDIDDEFTQIKINFSSPGESYYNKILLAYNIYTETTEEESKEPIINENINEIIKSYLNNKRKFFSILIRINKNKLILKMFSDDNSLFDPSLDNDSNNDSLLGNNTIYKQLVWEENAKKLIALSKKDSLDIEGMSDILDGMKYLIDYSPEISYPDDDSFDVVAKRNNLLKKIKELKDKIENSSVTPHTFNFDPLYIKLLDRYDNTVYKHLKNLTQYTDSNFVKQDFDNVDKIKEDLQNYNDNNKYLEKINALPHNYIKDIIINGTYKDLVEITPEEKYEENLFNFRYLFQDNTGLKLDEIYDYYKHINDNKDKNNLLTLDTLTLNPEKFYNKLKDIYGELSHPELAKYAINLLPNIDNQLEYIKKISDINLIFDLLLVILTKSVNSDFLKKNKDNIIECLKKNPPEPNKKDAVIQQLLLIDTNFVLNNFINTVGKSINIKDGLKSNKDESIKNIYLKRNSFIPEPSTYPTDFIKKEFPGTDINNSLIYFNIFFDSIITKSKGTFNKIIKIDLVHLPNIKKLIEKFIEQNNSGTLNDKDKLYDLLIKFINLKNSTYNEIKANITKKIKEETTKNKIIEDIKNISVNTFIKYHFIIKKFLENSDDGTNNKHRIDIIKNILENTDINDKNNIIYEFFNNISDYNMKLIFKNLIASLEDSPSSSSPSPPPLDKNKGFRLLEFILEKNSNILDDDLIKSTIESITTHKKPIALNDKLLNTLKIYNDKINESIQNKFIELLNTYFEYSSSSSSSYKNNMNDLLKILDINTINKLTTYSDFFNNKHKFDIAIFLDDKLNITNTNHNNIFDIIKNSDDKNKVIATNIIIKILKINNVPAPVSASAPPVPDPVATAAGKFANLIKSIKNNVVKQKVYDKVAQQDSLFKNEDYIISYINDNSDDKFDSNLDNILSKNQYTNIYTKIKDITATNKKIILQKILTKIQMSDGITLANIEENNLKLILGKTPKSFDNETVKKNYLKIITIVNSEDKPNLFTNIPSLNYNLFNLVTEEPIKIKMIEYIEKFDDNLQDNAQFYELIKDKIDINHDSNKEKYYDLIGGHINKLLNEYDYKENTNINNALANVIENDIKISEIYTEHKSNKNFFYIVLYVFYKKLSDTNPEYLVEFTGKLINESTEQIKKIVENTDTPENISTEVQNINELSYLKYLYRDKVKIDKVIKKIEKTKLNEIINILLKNNNKLIKPNIYHNNITFLHILNIYTSINVFDVNNNTDYITYLFKKIPVLLKKDELLKSEKIYNEIIDYNEINSILKKQLKGDSNLHYNLYFKIINNFIAYYKDKSNLLKIIINLDFSTDDEEYKKTAKKFNLEEGNLLNYLIFKKYDTNSISNDIYKTTINSLIPLIELYIKEKNPIPNIVDIPQTGGGESDDKITNFIKLLMFVERYSKNNLNIQNKATHIINKLKTIDQYKTVVESTEREINNPPNTYLGHIDSRLAPTYTKKIKKLEKLREEKDKIEKKFGEKNIDMSIKQKEKNFYSEIKKNIEVDKEFPISFEVTNENNEFNALGILLSPDNNTIRQIENRKKINNKNIENAGNAGKKDIIFVGDRITKITYTDNGSTEEKTENFDLFLNGLAESTPYTIFFKHTPESKNELDKIIKEKERQFKQAKNEFKSAETELERYEDNIIKAEDEVQDYSMRRKIMTGNKEREVFNTQQILININTSIDEIIDDAKANDDKANDDEIKEFFNVRREIFQDDSIKDMLVKILNSTQQGITGVTNKLTGSSYSSSGRNREQDEDMAGGTNSISNVENTGIQLGGLDPHKKYENSYVSRGVLSAAQLINYGLANDMQLRPNDIKQFMKYIYKITYEFKKKIKGYIKKVITGEELSYYIKNFINDYLKKLFTNLRSISNIKIIIKYIILLKTNVKQIENAIDKFFEKYLKTSHAPTSGSSPPTDATTLPSATTEPDAALPPAGPSEADKINIQRFMLYQDKLIEFYIKYYTDKSVIQGIIETNRNTDNIERKIINELKNIYKIGDVETYEQSVINKMIKDIFGNVKPPLNLAKEKINKIDKLIDRKDTPIGTLLVNIQNEISNDNKNPIFSIDPSKKLCIELQSLTGDISTLTAELESGKQTKIDELVKSLSQVMGTNEDDIRQKLNVTGSSTESSTE